VVFTDYKGMTVAETTDLRRMLSSSSIDYSVVKKYPCKDRFSGNQFLLWLPMHSRVLSELPSAMTILCSLSRRFSTSSRRTRSFGVKGAVVDGQLYGAADLKGNCSAAVQRSAAFHACRCAAGSDVENWAGALSATVTGFAYAMESLKSKKNT